VNAPAELIVRRSVAAVYPYILKSVDDAGAYNEYRAVAPWWRSIIAFVAVLALFTMKVVVAPDCTV
jgi:hypothetical protein